MNELSNKIRERIDANNVTPLPRWRFLLLRSSFWLLAGLSVIIGSLAVATILFLFVDYHTHGLWAVSHDVTEFLAMMPFAWIIVLVLFMIIAETSIEHTRRGYRYRLRTIVSLSMLLSIIFGSILNVMGVGKMTHEILREFPLYRSVTYDSQDAWSRPVLGRLAGVVLSVQNDSNFSIMDFNGHIWQVRLATSTNGLSAPEASSTVRMSGILEASSSIFIAHSIHEWEQ